MKEGLLVVISGASGTGKGTVCASLFKEEAKLAFSVSATTRSPREGEVDGVNYYFLSKEKFEEMIEAGEFLEWAKVYDNYYGTPLKKVKERLKNGEDVLLEIDVQGALNVMKLMPDGVFIFLLPPSMEELERRIKGRGTETEESLKKRLGAAKAEIALGEKYTYIVVNDTVDKAVSDIRAILAAERLKTIRNAECFEELGR
ncbi:MAG: guanylate kinase [Selenomonadaceae bacterium]|nr:guanylate kinase [Selenomonadaceae bacterium]